MSASPEHALYRLQRTRRDGVQPKRYRGTWVLSDDHTRQVLATCELFGVVTFREHEIIDHDGQVWRLRANRAFMPSRWLLSDPSRRLVLQFDQQILRKLLNPWRRTGLVLRDANGQELFRLVDRTSGVLDRIFGPGIDGWVVMAGGKPVAKLVRLPKEKEEPNSLLGRLGKLLARSDQGIASTGPTHVLAAPVALALLMLINELTNPSGVG
jgi:hypothetical protein